ncbi:MAG: hypothetical protein HAW59_05865, partial [Betaproteobacteria bacterium]|nr:hypothetical protein [Betaproteobacteria bacterium]
MANNVPNIATQYGKTQDEVRAALVAIGIGGRMTVNKETENKLAAYFSAQKKSAANKTRRGGSRVIGGTQVVEKKTRTINRPPKPALKAAPPPTAAP